MGKTTTWFSVNHHTYEVSTFESYKETETHLYCKAKSFGRLVDFKVAKNSSQNHCFRSFLEAKNFSAEKLRKDIAYREDQITEMKGKLLGLESLNEGNINNLF